MKISILGAGSWGIALANLCADLNYEVSLWEYRPEYAQILDEKRVNANALPGVKISKEVSITSDIEIAVLNSDIIILAIPSHTMRGVMNLIREVGVDADTILVSATKGIENGTLLRMSQVCFDAMSSFPKDHFAVLSGPSHAEEVSRKVPTAIVVASVDPKVASYVQQILIAPYFRVYHSTDVVGVELGGSLKNVIAIAAGICDGAGFGDNTKAALQPRGLSEIARLGKRLGANPLTFSGLSGMGDLIVTCMSRHSRNRYVGEQIGKGRKLESVLSEMSMVAEGVKTTQSAHDLAQKYSVEMPITDQVFDILFLNKDPREAVRQLLEREAKPELWA